ncbi:Sodium/solute symporter family and Sodium/solute symporter, subgroup family-containing protein [Strongyloides ratti]|uniref:Sodium/solute symporter family and Sodium/solute symporter, subgroup family-containing protein n=1 Tax=Strongyloides ratti TaxID=34506 RepID=A0A090L0G6_STRRB|nr:Sodium/solute symporter family and Sodium/solute symporter, subgroup family-containing protein [Strongyloides ratti]CEF63171.1 Sodium/solute symporter family and Sodium/solute symporter, subgroup family-containing protein [Strongyloides ratti]
MFQPIDFIIFIFFLLASILVGIYHAWKAKQKEHEHGSSAEYLTGGKKLPILPVVLSLLTTFISGIALLGLPAEIYQRGIILMLGFISGGFCFYITGKFFVPVFYNLQLVSVYQYFELRFGCKYLRRIGAILFLLSTVFYMAVAIYAPSVALVGISNLPLWPFILAVGVVSTIYTSIGGIKAVIWTDTLQAFFIYFGVGTLIIKGTHDIGGFFHVIEKLEETGRLSFSLNRFSFSLTQYGNIYILTIGALLNWICFYGLNQMALQRYTSMPSLKNSITVINFTIPAFIIIGVMCCFIGALMISYFEGCDPIALGQVKSYDQMSILMAERVLKFIPGLPGLFLSTLFSSTLSTISSGMNSMTAVIWEDFLKEGRVVEGCKKNDKKNTLFMKMMSLFIGIIATLLAFICDYMGGVFNAAVTTLSVAASPLVGVFFLGIFFPSANKRGAYAGLISGITFLLLCSLSYNIEKPYLTYVLPLKSNNISPGCKVNNENFTYSESTLEKYTYLKVNFTESDKEYLDKMHFGKTDKNIDIFARISPHSYSAIGITICITIGIIVSKVFPMSDSHYTENQLKLIKKCTYKGRNLNINVKEIIKNNIELVKKDKSGKLWLSISTK